MSQVDGSIIVDTRIDADGFKIGSKEIEERARKLASLVDGIGNKAKNTLNKQIDAFVKINQEYAAQEKVVNRLKNKIEEYRNQKIPTDKYAQLLGTLNNLNNEHEQLLNKMKGLREGTTEYTIASNMLEHYSKTIEEVIAKMNLLENSGKAYSLGIDTKEAVADLERLESAERKLSDLGNRWKTMVTAINGQLEAFSGEVNQASQYVGVLRSTLNGLKMVMHAPVSALELLAQKLTDTKTWSEALRESFGKLTSVLKRLGNTAKKALLNLAKFAGGFMLSGFKKISNSIWGIDKSANKTTMSLGRMLGMSLLFSSVFSAISTVTEGIKTGFQNLALYSAETNQSISMLMSSLTQLKNSFATAFNPILTVIAPILSTFIDLLSRAATYVGMFWAALFGQDYFIKAVPVQEDYAASISDTTENLEDVTDATKEAEKAAEGYLSPIDEINKMQKEINASSIATIPTVGSPAISTGDMFERVPINSQISSFVERLKDLVNKEDWNGLGKLLASKINSCLQKVYDAISWKNVGSKITAFTTAFTQTFNSLVDNINWDLLGRTVGAGINTIVNTINQLADGIDWFNLGRQIANGFNGLFREVDWNNLGHLIGNGFRIAWDIFGGFVNNLDFALIGRSVAQGLNGVFSTISFSDIASYMATALNGAFDSLAAFAVNFDWNALVTNITNGISTFIEEFEWTRNALKLNVFLNNLVSSLVDIADTIPWGDLGSKIGDSIGIILGGFDWSGLGEFLNKFITGLCDALKGVATVENFKLLGEGIANAIAGLPWEEVLFTAVELIKNAIVGLISGIWSSDQISLIEKGISSAFILVQASKITGIGTLATRIISWLATKLTTTSAMSTISTSFSTLLSGAVESIKGLGIAASNSVTTGFRPLLSAIGSFGAGIGLIAVLPVAASLFAGFIETLQGGNGKLSEMGAAINDLSGRLQNMGILTSTQADEILKIVDSCEDAQMSSAEMADTVMEKFAEWGISTQNVTSVLQDNDYWTTKVKTDVDLLSQSAQQLGEGMSKSAESINLSSISVKDGLGGIRDALYELSLSSDDFGGTYQGVLMSLEDTTSSATTAQEAMDMIIGQLEAAGVPTEEFIKLMQEEFPEATEAVKTSVDTNITEARKKIEKETGTMKTTARDNLDNIEESADTAFGGVNDTTVLNWGNSADEVKLNLRAMKLAASTELANMTETVRSYSQSMYNIMTKQFEYLVRDVGTIIGGIGDGIRDQMNNVISIVNTAIYNINNAIGGIESAMNFGPWTIPTATGYRTIGFSASFPRVNTVPYLASGAVIPPNKEFMAVLGDQKHGTNIEAPLETIKQAVRDVNGESGIGGGLRIPIYINGRQVFEAILDEAQLKQMRSGNNPFMLGGAY